MFIPNWIINKNSKTFLDLACGMGLPMKLINLRYKFDSTGVDIFEPYLKELKKQGVHNRYIKADIRKIDFKPKSFDIVMASQVVEHMKKSEALTLIKKMEKIAKKQVIIATPVGESEYETDDGNIYQRHKCFFYPEEFEKMGYKVIKLGGKFLFDKNGIAYNAKPGLMRKLLIASDLFLTPIYLLFPKTADYYFWAYKNL